MIDPSDSVVCVLEDANKGDTVKTPSGEEIILLEDVEFPVIKYGEEIGYMLADAPKGTWIHNHNMGCDRGKK